jgi:hypothetical protein
MNTLPIKLISTVWVLGVTLVMSVSAQSKHGLNSTSTRTKISPASDTFTIAFDPPPPPPDAGTPSGRWRGGGSRNECLKIPKQLIALVPKLSKGAGVEWVGGLTRAERPTLWFYVPYTAGVSGEFVLTQNDRLRYKAQFKLSKTPGIVSIELPASTQPLELDQTYRWYFSISCAPEDEPVSAFVSGWIKRVKLDSTLERKLENVALPENIELYTQQNLWYDALDLLAKQQKGKPNNPDWRSLLESIGLSNVANEPVLECCQPL